MEVINTMRVRRVISSCVLCLMLCIVALSSSALTCKTTKNQAQIRYFVRFHNDNEYLYSFKDEFEFPMEEDEAKKSDKYYKVYYGPDGKYYKAELFKNGQLEETYLFDSQERIIQSRENNIMRMWCYGENEKILVIIEGTRLSEYWVYSYEGDKLLKLTKYIPSDVILEYTVYDHNNWRYKTYDITGDPIDEGRMVGIGK